MANSDNPKTGADFERQVQAFFSNQGIVLRPNAAVLVGLGDLKKLRKFDLGSEDPPILVECKCHTWTAGGNSPSAKLTIWNEAMLYFSVAPSHYRKLLVVQRSLRAATSLLDHYLNRYGHLIPTGVEIWELDPLSQQGECVHAAAVPHFRMTSSLLQALSVPEELVIDFFITFARFEHALKQAGFVQGNESTVSPDWDRFSRELAQLNDRDLVPVLDRCEYLRNNPPKKQVLRNGGLTWVQPNRPLSEIESTLLNVRTVRNNVFHGGKFPAPIGPVDEPLRDERLLQDCLTLLNALVELPNLPNRMAEYFRIET